MKIIFQKTIMNYHSVFQLFRKLHGTKNEDFHLGFLLVNVTNVMESNGKLHFLCSIGKINIGCDFQNLQLY